MKSAIVVRRPSSMTVNKLPDRSDSEARYRLAMERSSKAFLQAILKSGKVYGPVTLDQELDAIAWAYDVDVKLS